MDYAIPERRVTQKDLKRKRLYNKYKKGGSQRVNYGDRKQSTS